MRTTNATTARIARYDGIARTALPHFKSARALGIKKARDFAAYLNGNCVAAPSGSDWTVDAVLRCLRRLKALGLDSGSLPPQRARAYGGPRKARPRMTLLKMPGNLTAEEQGWWEEQDKKINCTQLQSGT